MESTLIGFATLLGLVLGLVVAALGCVALMATSGCLIPPQVVVDIFVGPMLGVWYGPALVDSLYFRSKGKRLFAFNGTLHLTCDTVLGFFVGYHLGDALVQRETYFGVVSVSFSVENIIGVLFGILIGAFFYWNTGRWIRRVVGQGARAASVQTPLREELLPSGD